ncbi:MAG: hypothetical protein KC620_02285, partial [Myxococcales bacterium]|nr:hypothetical protein [Myxococcales bacterium]
MFSIEQLRAVGTPAPIQRTLWSGVRSLDALFGVEGLQSGQCVEWVGAPSCGKTGLLRALVSSARRQGVGVAIVDAGAELLAADWVEDAPGPLWVLRPPCRDEGAFCAEVTLRTGCFGLVVLDGAPPLDGTLGVRLQRLARKAAATLLLVRGPDERAGGGRVHRRFAFRAAVLPADDPLARRAPLTWAVEATPTRGHEA